MLEIFVSPMQHVDHVTEALQPARTRESPNTELYAELIAQGGEGVVGLGCDEQQQ